MAIKLNRFVLQLLRSRNLIGSHLHDLLYEGRTILFYFYTLELNLTRYVLFVSVLFLSLYQDEGFQSHLMNITTYFLCFIFC